MTWIAVPCFALLAVGFGLLVRSILSWKAMPAAAAGRIEDLSTARYKPMERLLAEDDFEFLAAQRGLSPAVARKLRQERRRIFRGYLRDLRRDFDSVYGVLGELMLHSTEDRRDLAVALARQKWAFTLALVRVEGRLAMHQLGLGSIDVSDLVRSLDTLAAELRHFALPDAQVSAV